MARIWIVDTEPHPRFSLYSRGNAGEVFPHVITVLTGSLIGTSVRAAQSEVLVETGLLRSEEAVGESLSSGVFGGYLYLNASTIRLFGVRMPGVSWRDADQQVMGDSFDAPPYVRRAGDRNLRATLAMCRHSSTMLRRPDLRELDEARTSARAWLATMPELTDAADGELLDWLRGFRLRQLASMKRLVHTGMMTGAPRGIIDKLLERSSASPGLANRLVGGTGDIDSARLAQRLWSIGRIVADDPALTAAFDDGLEGIRERTGGTSLERAVAEFLDDHGHRGNDEYELATPAWAMDPSPVYAAVDRLRLAPADRDPATTAARLSSDAVEAMDEAMRIVPRPLRPMVRRAVHVSRLGSIARERAKDILVFENLGARRVLHELVRRAAERGGPSDPRRSFCVTFDELEAYLADPASFAEVIDERFELGEYLNARVPPMWFEGTIPEPVTWPLRDDDRAAAPAAGAVLSGIAVSGGLASGRARVVTDPGDPRGLEPGEILVCAITDPSWTPLFLGAAAVVCDAGAVQSHAAIVARELGIPAVMSVAAITSVADGTMLHVDGHAGTVRIGDPAGQAT
jgi:pyruvate,water dikinase